MPKITEILAVFLLCLLSVVSASAATAAVVDGTPTYAAAKDAGLYVWRGTNGVWHMRLTRGGFNQNVLGGIATTRPYNWVAGIATESSDVLAKPNGSQINFNLNVGQSDFIDGIDFSVPDGAGLCLWTWGSFGKTVYIGSSITPVTPVGSSIDLLDNGGCVSSVKYHPGHYIAMRESDKQSDMIGAARPGVTGIHKRYLWKDLEPTPGNYDFSAIASDLQIAADHGMQLIVMLMDKTFTSAVVPTPPYLAGYTLPLAKGGYVSQRWSPYVIARLTALTAALGKRFDSNPNLEGIALQESSLGLTSAAEAASGYAPEIYRDALIQILKNTRAALPTSQVFWYMNFLEGGNAYLGAIAEAVAPFKIAMGGPDIMPDNRSLNYHTYPYYKEYKGRVTLFGAVEASCYNQVHADNSYPTKYWTMDELFQFARTQLHLNYIFWTRKTAPSPADSYDWTDAFPVIRANPPPF